MNGTCIQVNDVGKYRCDCFSGYVGFFCEFNGKKIATINLKQQKALNFNLEFECLAFYIIF